jgi:hypothetical protein
VPQLIAAPEAAPESPAPARLEPERYRVQFTDGEEYVELEPCFRGSEARGFLDVAAVPHADGEVLVIQVDGRGLIRRWERLPRSTSSSLTIKLWLKSLRAKR